MIFTWSLKQGEKIREIIINVYIKYLYCKQFISVSSKKKRRKEKVNMCTNHNKKDKKSGTGYMPNEKKIVGEVLSITVMKLKKS